MKKQLSTNQRQSNIELLRILAMLLIIISHFLLHTSINVPLENITLLDKINNITGYLLFYSGKVGVNLFIIITGYFSVNKNNFLSKIPHIYLQTYFYSVVIYLFWLSFGKDISQLNLYTSYLPFTKKAYWFVNVYIIMYSFQPILNTVLNKSKQSTIKNYLIYLTLLISFLPTYSPKYNYAPTYLYFLYLYLLGGAIRLKHINLNNKLLILISITIIFFYIKSFLPHILLDNINYKIIYKTPIQESFGVLITSLLIFNIFSKIKIQNNIINSIASSMFGVYLIHEHIILRPYIWNSLLNTRQYFNQPGFIVYVISISLLVLITCILIDKIFSKIYTPFIKYVCSYLPKTKSTK